MTDRRLRLRQTFDDAAAIYQQARPDYPEVLYDDLVALAGLRAGGRLLEVGCATGKATLPLARRGFVMTCVELGSALATEARRMLEPFEAVEVINADFDRWQPDSGAYDLGFAASVWGWVDPATCWAKMHSALREGGHFATFGANHVAHDDPALDRLWVESQPFYERWIPHEPFQPQLPSPDAMQDPALPAEASGLFEVVDKRRYVWEVEHDARSYTNLMRTFSNHIAIGPDNLDALCAEVADLIDTRLGGRVFKRHLAILQITRRL